MRSKGKLNLDKDNEKSMESKEAYLCIVNIVIDQRFGGLLNSIKNQSEWGRVPTNAEEFLN